MIRRRLLTPIAALVGCLAALAAAADRPAPAIPAGQFERLHRLIKPQPGESKWAQIPWLTDLSEARKKAAAEDKPLFVWRAGGGEVLGRA
jgi:hypothetical protein